MAENTPIIVYTAECIGNAANCLDPNEVKITDAVSAKLAFATDIGSAGRESWMPKPATGQTPFSP